MNSHISDVDTVQADDIAGAEALYANGPPYQSGPDAPVLRNLSTRGFVGTGDDLMIGGFIVQGSQPATLILRAIGLSLSAGGITGALADPTITVYDSNQNQIATNDDWFTSADAETIASFHLDPPNSRESALYLTLQPGAYTAVVQSFTDAQSPPTTGVGLFELYDLSTSGGRAGNISTRGQVLGGDNVLIGGMIIGGTETKTVIVRAIGPSLGAAGIANPLSDPTLELYDSNGAIVQSNDDWQQGPDAQTISDAGLAPTNSKESALSATLNPGAYTAIVEGVGGVTGVGLVEVYDTSPVPLNVGKPGRCFASVTALCATRLSASLGQGIRQVRTNIDPAYSSFARALAASTAAAKPAALPSFSIVAKPAAVVPPGVMTMRRSSSGESPLSSASCAAPRTVCVARPNDTSGGNPQFVPPAASASITV